MSVSVEWLRDEEGEYNEVAATVNGHELRVFSDRDGVSWDYVIDEWESAGNYDTQDEAQEAAVTEAMKA